VVVAGAAYFLLVPSHSPTTTVARPPPPPPANPPPDLAQQPPPSTPVDPQTTVAPPNQVGLVSPPPAAVLSLAEKQTQIGQVTKDFTCAELKPTVTDAADVRIEGFVSSTNDLDRLRSALGGLPALGPVPLDRVAVYGWPHCEVIKLIDETAAPTRPDMAPRLGFNIPSLVYKDGDKLIIQANATPAFDGFLYVDYLDSEGTVLHMLPAPEHTDNHLRAEQGLRLGGDLYAIGAPFGPNLVVAISSQKRLFPPRTEQQESAKTYLPVLTKALQALASSSARPVAAYTLINTVAR